MSKGQLLAPRGLLINQLGKNHSWLLGGEDLVIPDGERLFLEN